jgi:hypothetical protein
MLSTFETHKRNHHLFLGQASWLLWIVDFKEVRIRNPMGHSVGFQQFLARQEPLSGVHSPLIHEIGHKI